MPVTIQEADAHYTVVRPDCNLVSVRRQGLTCYCCRPKSGLSEWVKEEEEAVANILKEHTVVFQRELPMYQFAGQASHHVFDTDVRLLAIRRSPKHRGYAKNVIRIRGICLKVPGYRATVSWTWYILCKATLIESSLPIIIHSSTSNGYYFYYPNSKV